MNKNEIIVTKEEQTNLMSSNFDESVKTFDD